MDRELWNRVAAWADGAHPCQSYEWGQLLTARKHKVFRIAVTHHDEPVATALVVRLRGSLMRRCALCIPWGPVMRQPRMEVVNALRAALLDLARQESALLVRMGPALCDPAVETLLAQARLAPAVFPIPSALQYQYAAVLNLRQTDEDLTAAVKPKWRYNVRLAIRRGVEVTQSASPDHLAELAFLAQQDPNRTWAVDPLRLVDLWEHLSQAGDLRLFLARFQGRPAAAALCFAYGATCWLIANPVSADHKRHMPNHLLQWEIITWARDHGYHAYHMGPVSPPFAQPEDALWGLARFKTGFGAQQIRYVGCFDMRLAPLLYRLCIHVPRAALMLSGRSGFDYPNVVALT
ncbi:MAG: lipid II:glycine glycyltransferase FemX [Armatimonadota bacterium]